MCVEIFMKTISFIEAKNDLKAILDGVVNDENVTVITRCGAEDVARLLQQPYGNRFLLRSLKNSEHLHSSNAQYCAGKTVVWGLAGAFINAYNTDQFFLIRYFCQKIWYFLCC